MTLAKASCEFEHEYDQRSKRASIKSFEIEDESYLYAYTPFIRLKNSEDILLIISGRGFSFVVLVLMFVFFYVALQLAKKGKAPQIRRITAMDAIDEAVGRATEEGRPVHFTSGYAYATLSSEQGPQVLASIGILSHVAALCARFDVPIIYNTCIADSLPLVEETLRAAYRNEGKPESYDPKSIRYQPEQSPYVAAVLATLQRERPAVNMMIGGLYYESVVMGEAGNMIGATQIGGTANIHQMPFIIATCDYAMIGEEIFAASAYVTKDPLVTSGIAAGDWTKGLLILLTILGAVMGLSGIPVISQLLKW